jgi:thiol:disulfide interchange protein DsbD
VAQIDSGPKVHARLISESQTVAPGGTVAVAFEQIIRPHWHTYWLNPGDVGQPTMLNWSLPAGWKSGALQWPYPKRLPVGPFMDYGYEGKAWILTRLTASADAKPGDRVVLNATASWLVCKEIRRREADAAHYNRNAFGRPCQCFRICCRTCAFAGAIAVEHALCA